MKLAAGIALLAACSLYTGNTRPPDGGDDGYQDVAKLLGSRNLDVLFVIDDSSGMDAWQNALVAAFPAFVDTLNQLPGGLPDLHLGVVTSDVGTMGADDSQPGP